MAHSQSITPRLRRALSSRCGPVADDQFHFMGSAHWRAMPKRYGNWNSDFVRISRQNKFAVWDAGKRSVARAAASRPKFYLLTNSKGDPLTFDVTSSETQEIRGYKALMGVHDTNPGKVLGDRGYDSDEIRADLTKQCIQPVIPPRSNRNAPAEYDREVYQRRNLIERCVNRLKQFRVQPQSATASWPVLQRRAQLAYHSCITSSLGSGYSDNRLRTQLKDLSHGETLPLV